MSPVATTNTPNTGFTNKVHQKQRASQLLVMPTLYFLIIFFLIPLVNILIKSVANPEIHSNLPKTIIALKQWDGTNTPDEVVFSALVTDLHVARQQGVAGSISRRLGYENIQYQTMINTTLGKLPPSHTTPVKELLIEASPLWKEPSTWQTIVRTSSHFTSYYLLAAFDYKVDPVSGDIKAVSKNQAFYFNVLLRTLWMSLVITFFCVAIGFPLAYWLACQPKKRANLLLILMLVPFWASLLVCTTGWFVLLQNNGPVNYALMSLNIINQPLSFVPGRLGVYIAMVHILLPFIVLPLYSVMRGIPNSRTLAAISLGAHPFYAFYTVYLPQTFQGLRAGILLVFIMAIGYYITPSLLGKPADQMISYYIAYYTNTTNNWGMAAALSVQLIVIVVLLSWVYRKVSYKKPKRLHYV